MYEGQIPFDQQGRPVSYAEGAEAFGEPVDSRYVWNDNAPFKAHLIFLRFERGRSAAHAIYRKADNSIWEVTMFLSDLEDVINLGFAPLSLKGTFEYVKRGRNYGVKLIDIS